MKAGSILFDLSNHKIHIRILRYVFSYLNGYKDTYPKIRKDTNHIQKFSYVKRTLPAFICINPHIYILPETRASSSDVPPGAPPLWAELKEVAQEKPYAWIHD